MPQQKPEVRAKNYNEVALGYINEMALQEASRCIQCPKRPCVDGCPVNVDKPEFVKEIRDNNMPGAVKILKGKNALPGICGRALGISFNIIIIFSFIKISFQGGNRPVWHRNPVLPIRNHQS